jgi:2-dehydropantoate 2-reductase
MRILIVGAGGVGGFYGAYLLQAGRDVTFLVRPGRAKQLAEQGLVLVGLTDTLTIPAPPTVLASEIRQPYDLILLSCKAFDLESSIADLAPAVGPETAILPLLNGMAHLDVLDRRFGREHVLGGDTTVSTVKAPDGRILQLNHLDLIQFGDRDDPAGERMMRIAEALTVPGYTAELVPDVLRAMWWKWATISTAASLTCLMRAPIGDIVAAGATPLVHRMLGETSAIVAAAGYPLSKSFQESTLAKFTQPNSPFTASLFRDIEIKAPIEVDQVIGDLLARAQQMGVPTPLLEIVHYHLRTYEARRKREAALAA